MDTTINFSKSKEKKKWAPDGGGGGSHPRNRPIRILSNPNLRKDLFALYKGHFQPYAPIEPSLEISFAMGCEEWGQVRRFGVVQANQHPPARTKQDGWMDGWMVCGRETLFFILRLSHG